MTGAGHVAVCPLVAVPAVAALDMHPVWAVVAVAVALSTTAGRLSPDCDQRWPLRELVAHRGVTHWPGWPVAAVTAGMWLGGAAGAVVVGAGLGWAAHVLADWAFGAPWVRDGRVLRGAGVPWLPWGAGHAGLLGRHRGLRADGWTARAVTWAAPVVSGWVVWTVLAGL